MSQALLRWLNLQSCGKVFSEARITFACHVAHKRPRAHHRRTFCRKASCLFALLRVRNQPQGFTHPRGLSSQDMKASTMPLSRARARYRGIAHSAFICHRPRSVRTVPRYRANKSGTCSKSQGTCKNKSPTCVNRHRNPQKSPCKAQKPAPLKDDSNSGRK